YHTAKEVIDGHPTEVLRDGVILCSGLQARKLGSLELMELLRLRGVQNLGSVKHVYLEPSGQVSIFPLETPVLGLPIVPPVEGALVITENRADLCCNNCGTLASPQDDCAERGARTRIAAQMAPAWQ
ncbi:MAG: putative transrane protein, partial [Cypionkella sp.]|uniref:YetF domain-containing protein n=1 Tax=Cypionkella sp. TaxID=2811411 RepID=UPI002605CB62